MNKKLINKLKSDDIQIDDTHRQEIIRLGQQKIIHNQLLHHSFFNLFLSSIRFIRLQTWGIQLALLALSTFLVSSSAIAEEPSSIIIQCLTMTVIFSAIFFTDELFRSFNTGMWELEQTLTYDLRQHTIVRLLIFGLADLCLIIGLALISQGLLAVSFWSITLYLLVPFNITCIILFSLFTIWRNTLSSVVLWISAGVILVLFITVSGLFDVYAFNIIYWIFIAILSTIILGFIVKDMVQIRKWEAFC